MRQTSDSGASTTGPKLWIVLARAYRALAAYVESRVAAEGLCLSDFMVLEVLLHKGPMPISSIGQKVLLANASMTAAVDRLQERALVVRESAENDRRTRIVTLTPEGHAYISELYARHARDIEAITAALTPKEQDQLRSLLKKLGLAAESVTRQQQYGKTELLRNPPIARKKVSRPGDEDA